MDLHLTDKFDNVVVDTTSPWNLPEPPSARINGPLDQPATRARLPDAAGALHDVRELLRAAHRD
jgi:hypothetical protein